MTVALSIGTETLTVKELIEVLSTFPADMPVAYTWEGQITPVEKDAITVLNSSKHVTTPVLLLDAER